MTRIDVSHNYGMVADHVENLYANRAASPPADHPNARVCPQCQSVTWTKTRHCIVCSVDLFELDAQERRERQKWRRLKTIMVFGVIGWGPIALINHIPRDWMLPTIAVSVLAMMITAAAVKEL